MAYVEIQAPHMWAGLDSNLSRPLDAGKSQTAIYYGEPISIPQGHAVRISSTRWEAAAMARTVGTLNEDVGMEVHPFRCTSWDGEIFFLPCDTWVVCQFVERATDVASGGKTDNRLLDIVPVSVLLNRPDMF